MITRRTSSTTTASIAALRRQRKRNWSRNNNSSATIMASTIIGGGGGRIVSIRSFSTRLSSSTLFSSSKRNIGCLLTNHLSKELTAIRKTNLQRSSLSSAASLASLSCYVKDVMRTKRLSPPNPILDSIPSTEIVRERLDNNNNSSSNISKDHEQSQLPIFSILEPHHLEQAGDEVSKQHDVELAQLEVRWTSNSTNCANEPYSLSALLLDLDTLTSPVAQLREISELYETLASPPDKIDDWTKVAEGIADSQATQRFLERLYRSSIVYKNLEERCLESTTAASSSAAASTQPKTETNVPSLLVPFLKRGAHIASDTDSSDNAQAETMQQFQEELSILNGRLDTVVSYDRASKAMRLQCMSDMYNCIGLSRLQAESIFEKLEQKEDETKNDSVWNLARLQHKHMVKSPQTELMDGLFPELAASMESFLPKQAKLDLEGVGAFLEGKSEIGNSINSGGGGDADAAIALRKARYDFKQRIRLHGVLKGFCDFCDQILGIVVVEDTESNNNVAGWSKNVRLLHLYEKSSDCSSSSSEERDDDNTSEDKYLGTIYFDPFADSYWRTEDAKHLVKTRLFSQQPTGQTVSPVAIVALKITPIWDDTPVPMTWGDTIDLLHQFGKALQLILDQSRQQRNYLENDPTTIEASPIDTSDFLSHFLEMWLHNDGFLHRLAQLSQDEMILDDDMLKTLRTDLRNQKALELTNTMFLSALQFTVFENFDPRGDETLVSLQERLARQYLPGSNLPDPSDLSPLLAVFQESGIDQKFSAYGTLWSEVLAATVYETFQKTDLRDKDEVARLGTGIRDLFLKGNNGRPFSRTDIANLCKLDESSIGSGGPLKRVYGFETKPETNDDDDENNTTSR